MPVRKRCPACDKDVAPALKVCSCGHEFVSKRSQQQKCVKRMPERGPTDPEALDRRQRLGRQKTRQEIVAKEEEPRKKRRGRKRALRLVSQVFSSDTDRLEQALRDAQEEAEREAVLEEEHPHARLSDQQKLSFSAVLGDLNFRLGFAPPDVTPLTANAS